jgi:hypothetical protein
VLPGTIDCGHPVEFLERMNAIALVTSVASREV